ncbi:MAG: hypothetical protein ACJAXJ_001275 [Colwellia sp.]|jgi:hypothetical protein|tara:strand:- start:7433 stop:7612 length:180 start_codon:yes stop_codon:yes gene_type:complete
MLYAKVLVNFILMLVIIVGGFSLHIVGINELFLSRIFHLTNKKAFLEEKGLKCSLYGLV